MNRNALAGCLLLLSLSACASSRVNPGSTDTRHGSARAVDARMLAAADTRTADTLLVDSLLATALMRTPAPTGAEARARAARAVLLIGQVAMRERYETARQLLLHADTAVAANAAFALGLVRDTASVSVLERALAGAPDAVAAEAAWSLSRVGQPARAVLHAALGAEVREQRRGPQVRAALLYGASSVAPVPATDIVPFLDDASADVAFAAAYSLVRPRVVSATRALLAKRSHADAMVRTQVALAAAYNMSGDSLGAAALNALEQLRSDGSLHVRVQAVRSLATHIVRDAPSAARVNADSLIADVPDAVLTRIRSHVIAALSDSAPAVRVSAAEALGALRITDSLVWARAFAQDTAYMVQRAVLTNALRVGALQPELVAWQVHPDEWRRVASLELQPTGPGAMSPVERAHWARTDSSPRLRAMAVSAFTTVSATAAVRDTIRQFLGDESPFVRAAALNALASRATAADLPIALLRYSADSAPESHAVRSAALRLITSVWRSDSAAVSPAVQEQLARLVQPADPRARRSVSAVTPLAAWSTLPSARDLSDYQTIADRWLDTGRGVQTATLRTDRGDITLELLAADAPLTVQNFVSLAESGYFNGTRFHRVIPNFVAQDGDPTGTGSGGPGGSIRDELNRHRYARGAVGMALSGPDTGGSQYFLTLTPQPHLDGGYTVFARVLSGMDVMDRVLQGDRILSIVLP